MMLHLLRQQLDGEEVPTRAVLGAVADAPLAWKPHPASFSLGRLAMHVAEIPSWLPAFARADTYDMGAGGPGPAVAVSAEAILDRWTASMAVARATLATLSDGTLLEPWTLLRDGRRIATMPRSEAIARYVVRHFVHHRGQLTVYLRLCDVPVPPTYGDTADRRLLPPEDEA